MIQRPIFFLAPIFAPILRAFGFSGEVVDQIVSRPFRTIPRLLMLTHDENGRSRGVLSPGQIDLLRGVFFTFSIVRSPANDNFLFTKEFFEHARRYPLWRLISPDGSGDDFSSVYSQIQRIAGLINFFRSQQIDERFFSPDSSFHYRNDREEFFYEELLPYLIAAKSFHSIRRSISRDDPPDDDPPPPPPPRPRNVISLEEASRKRRNRKENGGGDDDGGGGTPISIAARQRIEAIGRFVLPLLAPPILIRSAIQSAGPTLSRPAAARIGVMILLGGVAIGAALTTPAIVFIPRDENGRLPGELDTSG